MSDSNETPPFPPQRYHYDAFIRENFEPVLNLWGQSPAIGKPAPDFPLWRLEDGSETSLMTICKGNAFTVVEFGSFT